MTESSPTLQRVIRVVADVFQNKGLEPPLMTAETPFDRTIGLESMDFAEVVVRLEEEFGRDPFSLGSVFDIRTLGDMAALYMK